MTALLTMPLISSAAVLTAAALRAKGLRSFIIVTIASAAMALGCMEMMP